MIRLNDITAKLLSYHPKADIALVEKAYVYSAKFHKGQVRLSGESYLSHPIEAAYIMTQMKMDEICIAAALLHDTIEDTGAHLDEIKRLFGAEAANIVSGVTNISKMEFKSQKQRQAENMRKMILAMSTDIRVILVKLADRLHNMRTLGFHPPEKQKLIASETLDIYAPLAGRMGIQWIKADLEDLCLYYLEPKIYENIQRGIAQRRDDRQHFIEEILKTLTDNLSEFGIKASVKGRLKHAYSIYKKMVAQNLEFDQVYDVTAFRVIVDSIKDCYAALGHIHSMWKPVYGRFKDYISVPKENMYQSLHTTVIGPMGQRMEIQIRTWDMDRVAEEGIAVHWKYKEGGTSKETEDRPFAWLRQLMEWQKNLKDPEEFMESVRMNLFPDEVYVFTPRGDVKSFPKGATPVDFAYSIHSEVGEKCMGAKVNGKMRPLRYELHTGDTVDIITSPKQRPRKDWLKFVKTPRAKTKIRHWLNNQEKEQSIDLGKDLLERALDKEKINLANLHKSEQIEAVSKELSFQSTDDLLAQIGFGKITPGYVIGRLKPRLGINDEKRYGFMGKMVGRFKRRKPDYRIKVKGVSDMLIRFANCCHPLPGEGVVGFMTRGRGITIHHKDCRHAINADPERLVEVSWEAEEETLHQARLRVTTLERKGLLTELSAIITRKDSNIIQAEVKTTMDNKGISLFTIEVKDYKQLEEIIAAIKKVKDVMLVERL